MKIFSSVKEIEAMLSAVITQQRDYKRVYSLDKMVALMAYLGNPQNDIPTIHVAGTSGKTSTSYYIARMLMGSGKKVGLTVSPHIADIRERAQINLSVLAEEEYCKRFTEFHEILVKSKIKPSYFEIMVAFSYWLFAKLNVDYAVVEVGLGGTLDGTNVISNPQKVSVITDIGFDHTKILGNTLPEITANKVGIILPNSVAFMHKQSSDVMEVAIETCEKINATLHQVDSESSQPYGDAIRELPAFQRRNWHLAYEVYEFIANRDALKIMSDNEARRAASLTVPGRMETFTFNGKTIILDGAHNSQKLAALYAAIQEKYPSQSIATLFGMIDEKFDTSIPKILMANESIIVTAFTINQDLQRIAMNPNTIAQELSMVPSVTCVDSPIAGLEELLDRQTDILLVTGSFFLVAAVRPYINDLASKKPH